MARPPESRRSSPRHLRPGRLRRAVAPLRGGGLPLATERSPSPCMHSCARSADAWTAAPTSSSAPRSPGSSTPRSSPSRRTSIGVARAVIDARFSLLTGVVIERRRLADRDQLGLFSAFPASEPGEAYVTMSSRPPSQHCGRAHGHSSRQRSTWRLRRQSRAGCTASSRSRTRKAVGCLASCARSASRTASAWRSVIRRTCSAFCNRRTRC